MLIILAVFWSSDSTSPLTHPHPIRERTTGQNKRSETTYLLTKKMPFCVMLAVDKQHSTWFEFPLRVNTAKSEMCHLSWADKGSKQNLQRGHHHPLLWPWTGMCFRKTSKTCSVFCSPAIDLIRAKYHLGKIMKEHLRVWLGESYTNNFQWSSFNSSYFYCDDGVQVYIRHFFSLSRLSSGTSECWVLPLFSKERLGRQ